MAFMVGTFAVDGDRSVMELVDIGEFGTSASGFQGWLVPVRILFMLDLSKVCGICAGPSKPHSIR